MLSGMSQNYAKKVSLSLNLLEPNNFKYRQYELTKHLKLKLSSSGHKIIAFLWKSAIFWLQRACIGRHSSVVSLWNVKRLKRN